MPNSSTGKVKPITPAEAESRAVEAIPSFVIEAFNELIIQNYEQGCARVTQKEAVELILSKFADSNGGTNNVVNDYYLLERGWLNVESLFKRAGWKVEYDKPGYSELYDAYYLFTKKK